MDMMTARIAPMLHTHNLGQWDKYQPLVARKTLLGVVVGTGKIQDILRYSEFLDSRYVDETKAIHHSHVLPSS